MTVVGVNANPTKIDVRIYLHSPEGKFLGVGTLSANEATLKSWISLIQHERLIAEQPMLPPWDTEDQDNVRFMPPPT